ncbi:MAG: hypothetical protein A3I68_02690 [Candidatus Melainabacteria bacterium RIFCSPLOWO2_02_FULL_35_15]|nr:MAG: hypothetical protein A3F80_02285 [Candidatus Melainabacteria bacterium RIFCSPLOWO2_12_FULL_35_11]OGI13039.1 MAG: hypothetical protein A3I68_02690 [Candidatus Melainabacteria bacterium RIFCSPLOWO2_02_FULL_35_15]
MKSNKSDLFFISVIFIIWLAAYIICQFVFPHYLGWDEVSYLSVARGIAENFDFGARSYTVMGILKYGFPTHLIVFPVFSTYIALFFKLFGVSQKIAYFSTWLAALGVCYFLYFIFQKLVSDNRKTAFIVAISYLFFPTVIKNCDTALMEQAGCFLLCLLTYILIKEYENGFNYFSVIKIGLILVLLWFFKAHFIGAIIGTIIFLAVSYNSKFTGNKIKSKIRLPVLIVLICSLFAVLYYIVKKYVFYPVAVMVNFHLSQELQQTYAETFGGVFNNFPYGIISNIHAFITVILGSYFIYPTSSTLYTGEYATYQNSALTMSSFYFLIGIYILVFLVMVALLFASWSRLSPLTKVFLCFSLGSILLFNSSLVLVFKVYHENFWRYNSYYLPLYICSLGVLIYSNLEYLKPFRKEHPGVSKALLLIFLVCFYIPLFVSAIKHYCDFEKSFYDRAHNNAELIKSFIKDSKPAFIYFNDGIHTTFTDYPIRQIFKDATNEQLLKINAILPEPIEFLFLHQYDWLFQMNKEQILSGKPIVNNEYQVYGYTNDSRIIVYRRSVK